MVLSKYVNVHMELQKLKTTFLSRQGDNKEVQVIVWRLQESIEIFTISNSVWPARSGNSKSGFLLSDFSQYQISIEVYTFL